MYIMRHYLEVSIRSQYFHYFLAHVFIKYELIVTYLFIVCM